MENYCFAPIQMEGEMKSLPNIPKTMKALVAHGGFDYRYEEIPVPEINEDEILVKVEDCGICAGDIKAYHGAEVYWGSPTVKPFMDQLPSFLRKNRVVPRTFFSARYPSESSCPMVSSR